MGGYLDRAADSLRHRVRDTLRDVVGGAVTCDRYLSRLFGARSALVS